VTIAAELVSRTSSGTRKMRSELEAIVRLGDRYSALFDSGILNEIVHEQENGSIIAGQSEISHPSPTSQSSAAISPSLLSNSIPAPSHPSPLPSKPLHLPLPSSSYFPLTRATTPSFPEPPVLGAEEDDDARPMDSPNPNSTETENDKSRNIEFSKDSQESRPLEARISRIFYLNSMGHEIFPRPNGLFLESLRSSTS
jgi:hypothetical protein